MIIFVDQDSVELSCQSSSKWRTGDKNDKLRTSCWKVAFVSGATAGIGRAIALQFAREGAAILVVGRRVDKGEMNRAAFETYIETQLAPTLNPGDVVILDNLSRHKSEKAKAIHKARGAWFLFTPPYSPDLNPIEMAFSKLKAHLRRTGARTIDALRHAIGNICDLYTPDECWNFLKATGYASD